MTYHLGTVTRAPVFCPHCESQTRRGLIRQDDGDTLTFGVEDLHRDGSFAALFTPGARVAVYASGISLADGQQNRPHPSPDCFE